MPLTPIVDQAAVQAAVDLLLPRVETAVRAAVEAAQARQRGWEVMPATVVKVDGPYAEVIMDDDPDGDLHQVLRLDEHHGVAGGVSGGRARVLVVRIPPHGGYTLGVLPDGRPDETSADGNEGFFISTTSDAARAPGAATDMTTTMDLTAGYLYGVHLHSPISVTGNVFIDLDQDGVAIGQPWREPAASGNLTADGWVNFIAVEDLEASVFTIRNNAGSPGTLTCQAAAGAPRTLMGICWGPARGVTID